MSLAVGNEMITKVFNTLRRLSTGALVLGAVSLAALLWSGYLGRELTVLGEPLQTERAPRGGVSLQLAATASEAAAIREEWARAGVISVAKAVLANDSWFILAYVAGWSLLAIWAAWVAKISPFRLAPGTTEETLTKPLLRSTTGLLVSLIVAAGLCDAAENWLLGITLGNTGGWLPVPEYLRADNFVHAVTLARLASMTKFSLLLFGIAGTVAAAGGAVRLLLDPTSAADREPRIQSFKDLVKLETDGIFDNPARRTKDTPECPVNEPADEQFVQFRAADVIGVALSGGGIRSATFNLGLLQGLQRLNLLRLFDYVSTVSGGGYVGSFWSEWLARQRRAAQIAAWRTTRRFWVPASVPEDKLFPTHSDIGTRPTRLVDTDQERHLREFSGFLAPRIGFFEVEMWSAIVALLGGLVPALLIGVSVIGIALLAWLAMTFPLASQSAWAPAVSAALLTWIVFRVFERMWQEFKSESAGRARTPTGPERKAADKIRRRYWQVAYATIGLVLLLQLRLPDVYARGFDGAWPIYTKFVQGNWHQAPNESGLVRWWAVTGVANPGGAWIFSPRLFDFALVWFATGLALLLVRMLSAVRPWKKEHLAAFDRVVMRVLGLAVAWSAFAAVWHIAINLPGVFGVAAGAAVTGGAFAALRNWIGVALRRPAEAGLIDRLKPYLPQVLAYITIALSGVAVAGVLIRFGGVDWMLWWTAAVVMSVFLVLAFFIKTDEFGLHAFYRDRISRAYAGACNLAEGQNACDNRGTDPREDDDRLMGELVNRPLHLVCCAANDLSGDQVETLSRGARSAVLSKHGFALGRYFHQWTRRSDQRLGSAITASAAAFNSNMGSISARVGPAVSFLMTMLNLRLGLWLRHPAARLEGPRRWPGLLLYREMFGLTSASGRIPASGEPATYLRDVHLSDGAHFENLALYELIRRHCRYVLVSDCGADPTVAFDDLGNALRRIREDFGVDIELDVAPLRPDENGQSMQHVAIGTIHYSPDDRGILLYVKPSITGDEPTDVLQYKTRNTAFPHESTGDQFYDEAQWESYRRLGLHAAESMFDFVAREDGNRRDADWLFAEGSHRWGPTPEGLAENVVEMTKRFGALEAELHQRLARGLVHGIFPEIEHLPPDLRTVYEAPPAQPAQAPHGGAPQGAHAQPAQQGGGAAQTEAGSIADVTFLMRVIQLMEDAWLTCQLDQWWTHPINLGWINLFARWATSPLFRFWWPLLSPMFSPGFRRFIEERFPMRSRADAAAGPVPPQGRVRPLADPPSGLAVSWWQRRSAQPVNWAAVTQLGCERTFYENVLELTHPINPDTTVPLQVGIVAVVRQGATVGWTSDDFFVPPSLWGAGMGWYFLKNLLVRLSDEADWCYVIVKMPPVGMRHQVALDDRRGFLEQYRKIGFREQRWDDVNAGDPTGDPLDSVLCQELGFHRTDDTLLSLDLKQWKQRQG